MLIMIYEELSSFEKNVISLESLLINVPFPLYVLMHKPLFFSGRFFYMLIICGKSSKRLNHQMEYLL